MVQKALFAAGCFWGVQDAFDMLGKGIKTTVGYTGGQTQNPTYEQVCSHTTGHAEAILIEYEDTEISYNDLLRTFWMIHNPTRTLFNLGRSRDNYRSAIFYYSEDQKNLALESKKEQEQLNVFHGKITTSIEPASPFYPAEEYHQKYYKKHGVSACHV